MLDVPLSVHSSPGKNANCRYTCAALLQAAYRWASLSCAKSPRIPRPCMGFVFVASHLVHSTSVLTGGLGGLDGGVGEAGFERGDDQSYDTARDFSQHCGRDE